MLYCMPHAETVAVCSLKETFPEIFTMWMYPETVAKSWRKPNRIPLTVEQIHGEGENLDLSLKLIPKGKILEAGHRAQMSWKNGGGKGGG